MIIKLVKYNGDIRYIKKEDITITQDMLKDADIYLIDDTGKTVEKVCNYKGLEAAVFKSENVLNDDLDEYEDLDEYDPIYLLQAAFNQCDIKDIYDMLIEIGLDFKVVRDGEIIN